MGLCSVAFLSLHDLHPPSATAPTAEHSSLEAFRPCPRVFTLGVDNGQVLLIGNGTMDVLLFRNVLPSKDGRLCHRTLFEVWYAQIILRRRLWRALEKLLQRAGFDPRLLIHLLIFPLAPSEPAPVPELLVNGGRIGEGGMTL